MNRNTFLAAGIGTIVALSATALTTFAAETTDTAQAATTQTTDQSAKAAQKGGMFGAMFGKMNGGGESEGHMRGVKGKGHKMFGGFAAKFNEAAQTALKNNDYTAFTEAVKGTKMEGKVTQEQFSKMVTHHAKQEAVHTALKNNDYDAFVKATTRTQEEFAEMVAKFKEREAAMAAKTK